MEELVSIITPAYNCARFIRDTIETVLSQTYKNWEMIIIDDASQDNLKEIVGQYEDKRIKLITNTENSGAAISRNNGIKAAKGKFICFLDGDDLWDKEKIRKQVNFMKKNKCAFSFTGYEFANENGKPNGNKVYIPNRIEYKEALKNTTIWTCTVMFNMDMLSKEDIYMPNVKSEDTACWWKVLKKVECAYGLNEILSYYRRSANTLSSNKIKAICRIWNLYRNVENLGLIYSLYNFCFYTINAVRRRI